MRITYYVVLETSWRFEVVSIHQTLEEANAYLYRHLPTDPTPIKQNEHVIQTRAGREYMISSFIQDDTVANLRPDNWDENYPIDPENRFSQE